VSSSADSEGLALLGASVCTSFRRDLSDTVDGALASCGSCQKGTLSKESGR
jgi:hypothetical protein